MTEQDRMVLFVTVFNLEPGDPDLVGDGWVVGLEVAHLGELADEEVVAPGPELPSQTHSTYT